MKSNLRAIVIPIGEKFGSELPATTKTTLPGVLPGEPITLLWCLFDIPGTKFGIDIARRVITKNRPADRIGKQIVHKQMNLG